MNKRLTTILIADNHPLMLEGLAKLIESDAEYSLVGQATNGNQAMELYHTHKPDLSILEIKMDRLTGIEVTKKIKKVDKYAKVILFTMHLELWAILSAKKVNPEGIILKKDTTDELKIAIKKSCCRLSLLLPRNK